MTLDAVKNFAKVEVSTGYDADDVSIVLATGDGAKLPDPAIDGAFNLVWWNSTDYPDSSDDPNKEIVRCTARSTDTLTVTRAQETTSASTKNTANKTYKMILAPTAKTITDIAAALAAREQLKGNLITVAESGGDHTSIQDAIDAAVAGDVVLIFPGTYAEAEVTLAAGIPVQGTSKYGVTLDGQFKYGAGAYNVTDVIINPSGTDSAFQYIQGSGARGLKIERCESTKAAERAIKDWEDLVIDPDATALDLVVRDCYFGSFRGGISFGPGGGTINVYNSLFDVDDEDTAATYTQSGFVPTGAGTLTGKFVNTIISVKRLNAGSSADSSDGVRSFSQADNVNVVFHGCNISCDRKADAGAAYAVNHYSGANIAYTFIDGSASASGGTGSLDVRQTAGTLNVSNFKYATSSGTITQLDKQPAGDLIINSTEKTTPVDADMVGLADSAASNILKKLSWSNIKATAKTYFDALYEASGAIATHSADTSSVHGIVDTSALLVAATAINVTEIANTAGSLKIEPDVQGDVSFFEDTQVGNDADGKSVYIYRKAAEGNRSIRFYTSAGATSTIEGTMFDLLSTGWNALIRAGSATYPLDLDINGLNVGLTYRSNNPYLRLRGRITAAGAQKYGEFTVDDATDYVTFNREDANILGLRINAPFKTVGNIGFFDVAPAVRQAHIVDADGSLADITTKFNTLLADLETYGLLATS